MADGLVNMADQFKGLPMKDLIGGPLDAAIKANVNLAQSTADFINAVGFKQQWYNAAGTAIAKKTADTDYMAAGDVRIVDFSFERSGTALDDATGAPIRTIEAVTIKAPMLAIVPIPNLQIDNVDISFDMEVKSSTSEKSSEDKQASLDATAKIGWGPFSVEVKIHGSVASHKENTRSSDNSAKYHVEIHATNHGMPEGLARVMDIMAQSQKPSNVVAYRVKADGTKDGAGVPLPPNSETTTPRLKAAAAA
ncbi:hypothetical protein WSM22_37700 [Cytophagales bacterium WSM2-2]|nr:hypothetical protein WSM22_37700 [Cytophagales bacterium WSM2-2]